MLRTLSRWAHRRPAIVLPTLLATAFLVGAGARLAVGAEKKGSEGWRTLSNAEILANLSTITRNMVRDFGLCEQIIDYAEKRQYTDTGAFGTLHAVARCSDGWTYGMSVQYEAGKLAITYPTRLRGDEGR